MPITRDSHDTHAQQVPAPCHVTPVTHDSHDNARNKPRPRAPAVAYQAYLAAKAAAHPNKPPPDLSAMRGQMVALALGLLGDKGASVVNRAVRILGAVLTQRLLKDGEGPPACLLGRERVCQSLWTLPWLTVLTGLVVCVHAHTRVRVHAHGCVWVHACARDDVCACCFDPTLF